MFLYRYFTSSLKSITGLYALKDEKIMKVLLYFILITMIYSFPMNFFLVKNDGLELTRLTFTRSLTEDYVDQLPSDCVINYTISCTESNNKEVQAGNLLLVFNADENYVTDKNSLVYYKDKMVFRFNDDIIESGYHFEQSVNFSDLKTQAVEDVSDQLISGFEGDFEPAAIIMSIVFYTGNNLMMNAFYILIASLLALLLRYGLKRFLSYKEAFKLFVFSSTWPILIAVIIGMLGLYPFMPVIYQYGTPLMFLFVYYRNIGNVR